VQFRGTKREASWRRIQAMIEPEGIAWNIWQRDDYPNWSLPALEAAKCAGLQGEAAYEDMHFRLFQGFFEHGKNIANVDEVTLDPNHPLAGVALTFDVEIMEIRDATGEELSHGHVHGEGEHHH
jgi:hypothetical protein